VTVNGEQGEERQPANCCKHEPGDDREALVERFGAFLPHDLGERVGGVLVEQSGTYTTLAT
jgi:hypothetical protein